jgi:hypothetical protein
MIPDNPSQTEIENEKLKALGTEFLNRRKALLLDNGQSIIDLEKRYMDLLTNLLLDNAEQLRRDFNLSSQLRPFWASSQPQQRGRMPIGDSVPYIEVGETSLTANITRLISNSDDFVGVRFPGLPAGGDMRFMTNDAFIHLDIKVTGPRDELEKVVLPPHQYSGDGANWGDDGVVNSTVSVYGWRTITPFIPGLPPFYVIGGETLICLIYVLKTVYSVDPIRKIQPLRYLELVSVPNGLLLFTGLNYQQNNPGLLSAGKDDQSTPIERRRRRLYLNVLSEIAPWRCVMIVPDENNTWQCVTRYEHNHP